MKFHTFFISLLLMVVPFGAFAQNDSKELKSAGQITFSKGYIDDRFAIDSAGKTLAYVTVEAKGKAMLRIRDLAGGKERSFELTKTTNEPKELFFVDGFQMIVVVLPSGTYNDYIFFDFTGKKLGILKGLTDLVVKDKKIITYRRYSGNGAQSHTVQHVDPLKLKKPEKKMVIRGDMRGRVTIDKDNFDIAYFTPDYSVAIGKVIGKYDKKTDSKTPDMNGHYDMATKTLKKLTPISNNSIWDKSAYIFYKNFGIENIVDLQGSPTVKGVSGLFRLSQGPHKWTNIKFNYKLGRFEFKTLHQVRRLDSAGKLWFSMLIDPQNPITLKNLKSEKRYIHFFSLDPKTSQSVDEGRVAAPQGLVAWKKGGAYIALMRLSKYWTVGSETLEIYRVH